MIYQNQLLLLPFDKRGGTGGEGIILGVNPARYYFLLRNLIAINFFQISHDCATEIVHRRQNF